MHACQNTLARVALHASLGLQVKINWSQDELLHRVQRALDMGVGNIFVAVVSNLANQQNVFKQT